MKKLMTLGLSAILSVGLIAPTAAVQAVEQTAPTTYTINFKGNKLPADVQKLIQSAGGSIINADEDLAFVQAVSSNPQFLNNISNEKSVDNAGRTVKITHDAVEKVELNVSSDHPIYDQYQWDIKQVTENGESYKISKGTKDVVVAVIDTGIDLEHPDLKANIVDAKSFVPGEATPQDFDGHGSHVAGSIAANGQSLGIGPELGIAGLKVFAKDGGASTASIAQALKYAADKDYDVVNMSLGSYQYKKDPETTPKDIQADINLFKKAISYADQKGVTVVGSAGNAGVDIHNPAKLTQQLYGEDLNGATHRDPAGNLIRVSAGNLGKQLTFYSNYGVGKINVMAPGGDLGPNYDPETGLGRDNSYLCLSTVPQVDAKGNVTGHGYAFYAGTSMAAPKVAGVAGVIIAKHGKNNLKPAQVKAIIEQSAEDIYKKGKDAESGSGLANAYRALNHK
ncbi:S8 family serine peptidase [Hazenella coriacea]|uniref:Subtilase family protein n=1 Tax=Hazenella coriacea TaxID=1179467 RepID=A0A4R3L8P3_9BACL|nr:S8 family serine peptidase [Hazenella coriacea]TCS96401.1 subtilase family protein [Hazenella coriacea]